jgi:hypothetical protein
MGKKFKKVQWLDDDLGIEISVCSVGLAQVSILGNYKSGLLCQEDIIKLINNLSKCLFEMGKNEGKLELGEVILNSINKSKS